MLISISSELLEDFRCVQRPSEGSVKQKAVGSCKHRAGTPTAPKLYRAFAEKGPLKLISVQKATFFKEEERPTGCL